jgi:cytidylate kinase
MNSGLSGQGPPFPFHVAGDYSLLTDLDAVVLPADAVVAIDGPAGSGKSTTAKALAERFGLLYIDSGAMYRALTATALAACADLDDEEALLELCLGAKLELKPGKGEVAVFWNGQDLSKAIRTPEVDSHVSRVAAHPGVRADMVARQQEMGRCGGVVMEGRDIGSVVFPLATTKIFLHASLEARTQRRYQQNLQRGHQADRDEIMRELASRDEQDSQREVAPLTCSPDAFVIDSSEMTLAQQNEACARACLINPALDRHVDTDRETALKNHPWHYRLAYAVFNFFANLYGLKVVGNYRGRALPRGFLVAVNHISLWDPPLVGATFLRYRVHTLAKRELFQPDWLLGRFFRWLDSIPISRKGFDKEAFRQAGDALKNGHNLVIFPEGTRRAIGHPGPVRNGLGIVVQATRAPFLPIFIRGSYGRQIGGSKLSPLEVTYGPYIRWHGIPFLLENSDRKVVSRNIASLCEQAYREMQARSFQRYPQTDFERELGERQLVQVARRDKKVFRN